MIAMRSTHNWIWALGVLVVWVAIFLAFLLISISRPWWQGSLLRGLPRAAWRTTGRPSF